MEITILDVGLITYRVEEKRREIMVDSEKNLRAKCRNTERKSEREREL